MQRGLSSFRPTEVILTHEKKVRFVFLIFLEGVTITSVGQKLDRPQLQHWLLFSKHNRLRSKDLNVAAGLPVPMGYDCVYDSV